MVQENISLKPYNTFHIDECAAKFASFNTISSLKELLEAFKELPLLIIGGGSNILLTGKFNGLVLKNEIKGIDVVDEDDDEIYIKAGAGENWHELVLFCVDHNYGGLENLSLIPGNVGASPMQNIGAYGVELKDTFFELEAYDLKENTIKKFNKEACNFGYRDSVFKNKYKGQFIILNVTFKLSKQPVYNTSYGAIEQELKKMNVSSLSIQAISQAVINIRRSKLPDPNVIGNAGSFFKNPEVEESFFKQLKSIDATIPGYNVSEGKYKIPAAWLIEKCGWKGFRDGDAGCHKDQALVLVNYGSAKGEEILSLANRIINSVKTKFNVDLEKEVNLI